MQSVEVVYYFWVVGEEIFGAGLKGEVGGLVVDAELLVIEPKGNIKIPLIIGEIMSPYLNGEPEGTLLAYL